MLTYRGNEIEKGFALGNRTSLLTGEALHTTSLLPSIALREIIGERVEKGYFDRDDGTQGCTARVRSGLLRRPDICTVRHETETTLTETKPPI